MSERRLLQDVSHELRSPLARLAFAVELAKTSDDREVAIGPIQKQIQTLKTLVSSLLQVTRVGEGAIRDVEEFRLASVIDDVVEANDLNAREKRCRSLVAGTISPSVTGNRQSMTRALDNVVRNAGAQSICDAARRTSFLTNLYNSSARSPHVGAPYESPMNQRRR